MEAFEEYGRNTKRVYDLIHLFFEKETTSQQRKELLAEIGKDRGYLANALFNIIGWEHRFEKDGQHYTLQYNSTYNLSLLQAGYELNLYVGSENKTLIKQEKSKRKAEIFFKFLTLADAEMDGNFDLEF